MNDYFNYNTGRLVAGEPALANDVNSIIDAAVVGFDQLPSKDALTFGTSSYAVATGPANVYAVGLSASAYTDGMLVTFKASASNTGASSINVGGLGAKQLVSLGGGTLVIGDILANSIYTARYNTTSGKFELQGLTSGSTADISTVATNITDVITVADNIVGILAADGRATAAAASATEALGYKNDASGFASAASVSAANLPNATTGGANKSVVTNGTGNGWLYKTAAEMMAFIGASNGDNITSGTIADARIASTICRDSELSGHTGNTSNPHSVTKTQVGLSGVPNTDCTNASNISSGTLAAARIDSGIARLSGPIFISAPKAPTPAVGTNNTEIATTAFVSTAVSGLRPTIVPGVITVGGVMGFDISKTGANQLTISAGSCLDSTITVAMSFASDTTLTIPSVANTIYHVFIVRKVADGLFEARAYLTEAAAASDVQVNAFRWIGFWRTDGSANCFPATIYNGTFSFTSPLQLTTTNNAWKTIPISTYIPSTRCFSFGLIGYLTGAGPNYVYARIIGGSSEIAKNDRGMINFEVSDPNVEFTCAVAASALIAYAKLMR